MGRHAYGIRMFTQSHTRLKSFGQTLIALLLEKVALVLPQNVFEVKVESEFACFSNPS